MRPLLASQCLRLAERHKYTGSYKGIITFYCTSESGAKLLDKEWLNCCLVTKDFTAFSSAVWPIHHPLLSAIFSLHLLSSFLCFIFLSFNRLFLSSLIFSPLYRFSPPFSFSLFTLSSVVFPPSFHLLLFSHILFFSSPLPYVCIRPVPE